MLNVLRGNISLGPLDEKVVKVVFVPDNAGAGGIVHDVSIYKAGQSVYTVLASGP